MRWRLVSGSLCVCSYYAPHAGSGDSRIQFWEDLVASVRLIARVFPVYPFLSSGDANVWWPDFCLGRTRSCDRVIFPFIVALLWSTPLTAPPTLQVLRSSWSLCPATLKATPAGHSAPPVVQLSGQTSTCVHFLSPRSSLTSPLPSCFPIVEDWFPFLVSAQESLVRWGRVVQQCLQSEPGGAARHTTDEQFVLAALQHSVESHPPT